MHKPYLPGKCSRRRRRCTDLRRVSPFPKRERELERKQRRGNAHPTRKKGVRVLQSAVRSWDGSRCDNTSRARPSPAREPEIMHLELAACSSRGLMSGMRDYPTAEAEGRDAGGAGGAPCAEALSSLRPSATAASLPTAPGDAGASGARKNSAPISVRRIPLAQVACGGG